VITEAPQNQERENSKEDLEALSLRVPFLRFYHVDLPHVPRLNVRVEVINRRDQWVGLGVSEVNEQPERLFNHEFEDWIRVGQSLLSAYAWR
jgi:hypothetical protein